LLGVSVFKYVQLRRMKRAAYRLAFRPHDPVLEIALDCAYDGPEAFSRAFKKHVGSSPSQFRRQPQWSSWWRAYRSVFEIRSQYMQPHLRPEHVRVVDFPDTRVAALEHRGDPVGIGDSIRKFVRWRKEHGLSPKVSATFNVFYVDIEATPAEEFRMDLCVSTDSPVEPNEIGVVSKLIPGGRCALLRHVGSEESLDAAIRYLYAQWLPASGEEPRDYPLFLQRISFFPDVPEHDSITDIFLPLRE
jgi:AraC family transcriptional regulator